VEQKEDEEFEKKLQKAEEGQWKLTVERLDVNIATRKEKEGKKKQKAKQKRPGRRRGNQNGNQRNKRNKAENSREEIKKEFQSPFTSTTPLIVSGDSNQLVKAPPRHRGRRACSN